MIIEVDRSRIVEEPKHCIVRTSFVEKVFFSIDFTFNKRNNNSNFSLPSESIDGY
jgi:hypothetical protein